jgi:hypothetical protein
MSRPQRVRVPWRVITSAYADATVAVYIKVAALARRIEGCEAGVAYLSSILPVSRSSVERGLTQLHRPDPVDDVVEMHTTRRTHPGGRGQTAVRRPRVPGPGEPFVWVPSRAPEALPPRLLRAYAAVSHAVMIGHPLTLGELGGVLRHRSGQRAGQPLSDTAVRRVVDALEELGWISVDRRAGAHGRHLYTVHDEPFAQLSLDLDTTPDLDDGSGGDHGEGSLATKEDHRTDSPDDAPAGGSIRRRRGTGVARGPVENVDNPTFTGRPRPAPPAARAYTGPALSLAPRIWNVLAPVHHLLPGLSPYVVRQLARDVGRQLDWGIEPARLRARLEHRYASTETIRDSGRWLLGAAVRHRGCGWVMCESGRIWRTGESCPHCAAQRRGQPTTSGPPAGTARPPLPVPAGAHPYVPDRRGACGTCDLPAAHRRHTAVTA